MAEHQYSKIETGSTVFKPLYPPEGGPLAGFLCVPCSAVTRTRKGMILHLAVCHGIRLQLDLTFEPATNDKADVSDPGWTLPELPG